LSRPDTRNEAKLWIEGNVPRNSRILIEGSYGNIIAGGPPLESNLDALDKELSLIIEKGGSGMIWRMRKDYVRQSQSITRYFLYKTINLTMEDIDKDDPEYIVISGYYNYPRGYLLTSLEDRKNLLQALRKKYKLLKRFMPFPNMDNSPHLVLMDFRKLNMVSIFRNKSNAIIQGPTIEIYKRI
jgi:hypothetical protein